MEQISVIAQERISGSS